MRLVCLEWLVNTSTLYGSWTWKKVKGEDATVVYLFTTFFLIYENNLLSFLFLSLANAVYLLKELREKNAERNNSIIFMYDIACKLQPHVQVILTIIQNAIAYLVQLQGLLCVFLLFSETFSRVGARDQICCASVPCIWPWVGLSGISQVSFFKVIGHALGNAIPFLSVCVV